jgi:hypothetical protein
MTNYFEKVKYVSVWLESQYLGNLSGKANRMSMLFSYFTFFQNPYIIELITCYSNRWQKIRPNEKNDLL